MGEIVIRGWTLHPTPDDQALRHVHHRGDEAFIVLSIRLTVEDSGARHVLGPGQFHVVEAGSIHTFATACDEPVRVRCVMSAEIDDLIRALHHPDRHDDERVWAEHHSSRVDGQPGRRLWANIEQPPSPPRGVPWVCDAAV
jgi:uncharacterized cupin superfamily protein